MVIVVMAIDDIAYWGKSQLLDSRHQLISCIWGKESIENDRFVAIVHYPDVTDGSSPKLVYARIHALI